MGRSARDVFVVIAVLGWGSGSLSAQTGEDFALTVLHTNDVHSIYEFIDLDAAACRPSDDEDPACFIAAARLATAIKEARARNTNSILLDAGDQFPSPRFSVPPDIGRPLAAELMNRMGYDAMTLGNHEFDDGTEVLSSFVDALDFPALTADESALTNPVLGEQVETTVVLEVAGEPIGLIGLGAVSDPFAPAPDVLAQRYADDLTARGINKIIAISHFGYTTDQHIAEATNGIDVIVGGHSHTRLSNSPLGKKLGMAYPTMVNGVAVVQAYAYGTYLGELHLTFDKLGNLTSASGDPIPMDAVKDDEEIKALVEEVAARIPAVTR